MKAKALSSRPTQDRPPRYVDNNITAVVCLRDSLFSRSEMKAKMEIAFCSFSGAEPKSRPEARAQNWALKHGPKPTDLKPELHSSCGTSFKPK